MMDRKRRGSYKRGLTAGIVLGMLAMCLTGCAAGQLYSWMLMRGHSGAGERVDEKLEELNSYIEQYYLFDYEEENLEDGIYKGMCIPVIIHQRNTRTSLSPRPEATAVSERCCSRIIIPGSLPS